MTSLALAACGSVPGIASPQAAPAPGTGTTQPPAPREPATITVYSGRSETLVGPLLARFEQATGVTVRAKYGDTAALASTILEEGANTPADVFFAQDAGALGALQLEKRLEKLPNEVLQMVEPRFRSAEGVWVGASGRARVVAYNTKKLTEADLPSSLLGFTDAKWKGRLGWAPTNASLQAHVTAMRVLLGEARTREWLQGIKNNQPKVYANNTAIVQAVGAGEIDAGYLYNIRREQPDIPVKNFYHASGDVGALINVAGVGLLKGTKHQAAAEKFAAYLLSPAAQEYFAKQTFEYPLVTGVPAHPDLKPLAEIKTPAIDLSDLADLRGTLELLRQEGIL